jgi:broad specificity phosphatase PhoE
LKRTHETVEDILGEKFAFSQLNEIDGGDLTGLSYEEIEALYPVEYAKRNQDKLRYRYPNGESYLDICR